MKLLACIWIGSLGSLHGSGSVFPKDHLLEKSIIREKITLLDMYIYNHVCIYIIYIHIYLYHIYIYAQIFTLFPYICMYMYINICIYKTYVYMSIWYMYVCVYIYSFYTRYICIYFIYIHRYIIYTYIYIYIYIHLACCSILTFIILCHNVCSLMLFKTKFLTCLTEDFFSLICSK